METMTTISPTPAAAIAAGVDQAWRTFLQRDTRVATAHPYVYASAWRECDRRMVYEMTVPEQLPPWPAEVLAKFRRGSDRERDLLSDLMRIGRDAEPSFTVVGQQERFTLRDRKSRTVIAGKVDARLDVAGVRAPLEVKAWSPLLVDRIETFGDVFENPWTQSGGYQLLSYLYGAAEPFGFLLLDRSGVPKLLPVELDAHLDRVEAFLTRAEHVVDHFEAQTLPDYLADEPDTCIRCPWYGAVCNPPLAAPGAMKILNDPELEAALQRREELRIPGKAFAELDDEIKKRLRGITRAVVGAFEIKGFWGKQSHLELPADLKAKYTTTDPKGRFTLQITKR